MTKYRYAVLLWDIRLAGKRLVLKRFTEEGVHENRLFDKKADIVSQHGMDHALYLLDIAKSRNSLSEIAEEPGGELLVQLECDFKNALASVIRELGRAGWEVVGGNLADVFLKPDEPIIGGVSLRLAVEN